MCGSRVDIQSATAEIRRGKKERRRTNDRMKIYMACPNLHRAAIMNCKSMPMASWSQQLRQTRTMAVENGQCE